jgi:ankyrin repeat protein
MSYNQKENMASIKKDMCMTNNLDIIKSLIEEGICINEYGIGGHTPIHFHVKEGNFDIVKYLLSKGADINKKNIYGDNVIDDALKYNQDEIYEYLLNMKINNTK